MKRKVDRCEKMLKHLIETLRGGNIPTSNAEEDDCIFINGKNVMRLSAPGGAYQFGFQLLDMLFTKEELGKSLLYEAKSKSNKPALDPARVEKLLFLVNKRFGDKDNWDEKTLVKKLNQKCRDSLPKKIK